MKLAAVLRDLATHLTQIDARFALVGGIATSARAEPRFTRDVDVAVAVADDKEAEGLLFQLRQLGYVVIATVEHDAFGRLATARLKHPSGVVCDLIFATCGVENEIIAHAHPLDVFDDLDVMTASVEGLLAMKVLSSTDQRPRDLDDIRALIHARPAYDENHLLRLLDLITQRGFDRGQNLISKWTALKGRFSA